MAISAYAVSLPLFLRMTPVVFNLVLSMPVALMFSLPPAAQRTQMMLGTPESNDPPQVLTRANALIVAILVAPSFDRIN